MKVRINLGSGTDYKKGWYNIDKNDKVKADKYESIDLGFYYLKDNSVDYILVDHTMEHLIDVFFVMDEIYRVLKPGGTVEIYVPHYSGVYALKHLDHKHYFGIGSFDIMTKKGAFNREQYNACKFDLIEEKLIFWHHKSVSFSWIYKIFPDFIFNFNRTWRQLVERFWIFGFDEIKYVLRK